MPLNPGSDFGPYRIVSSLGRGGMATVYKAYEAGLDRFVALKVLPAAFLHDPDFAERFTREARVIARLEHPRIVPIYAFGIDEDIPWMAMRLVPGGSLSGLLKRERIPLARAVAIIRDVADGLQHAHGEGVLHRDVKPQNILLHEKGYVYLADFGIAKMVSGSTALTKTGRITGTPQYMSPEQAKARQVDHRSDIYALGIIMYEMLTGKVPFTGDTPMVVMMHHIMDPVPPPDPSEVPAPLVEVVERCLAKDPENRWETATAFASALEGALGRAGAATSAIDGSADATTPWSAGATGAIPAPKASPAETQGMYAPTDIHPTPAAATAPEPVSPSLGSTRRWAVRLTLGAGAVGVLALLVGWLVLRGGADPPPRAEADLDARSRASSARNQLLVSSPTPTAAPQTVSTRPAMTPSTPEPVAAAPSPTPRTTPEPKPVFNVGLQGQVVVISHAQNAALTNVALVLRDRQGDRHALTLPSIAPGERVYVWASRWIPPLASDAEPRSLTITSAVSGREKVERVRF